MASTYTLNQGIEKPGTGEQSGTWGNTTNTNFDIIDRALSGVGAISLTGTTTTLTTTDGSLTDGMYKVLVLGGSPSGTNTITIGDNTQDKLYFVVNSSGQEVIFTQGTGANATIANGAADIIYADGAGSGAAVASFFGTALKIGTDLTIGGDSTFSGDTHTFSSANSTDPLLIIKNTTNDANGSRLHFVKDKGAAGADGDDIGTIEFISDDDGQTQTSFAKIVAEVSESANTDEAGKLSFFVAESDGTTTAITAGLILEGEHATDGEVDVTIGAGAASTTTISGILEINGKELILDADADTSITADTDDRIDFRVGGSDAMHILPTGQVAIGTTTAPASDAQLVLSGDGSTDSSPFIEFVNTSASNDETLGGFLSLIGSDSVAEITARRNSANDDAYIFFGTQVTGGSLTEKMRITSGGGLITNPIAAGNTIFNEGGVDADFRIESDNDIYAFFLNGANGHVSIGSNNADYMGSSNTSGVLSLTVPSGGYSVFELAAEGADSANALAGTINFINTLQTGGNQLINVRGTTEGSTSGDRGGRFSVGTKADGGSTPIERMRLISTGFLKVRGGGGDYISDTGEYHEFIGTASGSMPVRVAVQNTSYADHGFSVGCTRTSSNAYSLISAFHGNGSSDAFNDRVFTVTGQGEIASDHSTSITSGADYAEYFEWKDGNSSSEDRIGQSVVLDGNQIRKATSDDSASNILGVISGNPSVVGDSAELRWQGKYELDDFNRRKTEEVEVWEWTDPEGEVDEIGEKHPKFYSVDKDKVPDGITVPSDKKVNKVTNDKESSSYDASKKDDYVPRSQRKEWDAVGLMGKLRLLKGQPTGDRWIKMRDVSDTVEEWLVR